MNELHSCPGVASLAHYYLLTNNQDDRFTHFSVSEIIDQNRDTHMTTKMIFLKIPNIPMLTVNLRASLRLGAHILCLGGLETIPGLI